VIPHTISLTGVDKFRNDHLPCWTMFKGQPHLVTPYSLVVNDARFVETLPHSYQRPRSGQRIRHCSSPHATGSPPLQAASRLRSLT